MARSFIGVFIILFIAMIFVVKFCKKVIKTILSLVIILLVIYCTIISIDMNRTHSFRKPIFAVQNEIIDLEDHKETTYKGIGYTVVIETLEEDRIESITMYFLGKVIAAAIT